MRAVPGGAVGREALPQRGRVHPPRRIHRDPPDGVGAQAEEIGRLLDPGVGGGRDVDSVRYPPASPALRTPSPSIARRPARKQTKLAMLPPLTRIPPHVGGIAHQLRDPADRLRLDLGRGGRQLPAADVGIDRRGEQVRQGPDRRRRGGDVAHEAGMAVAERVAEEQVGGLVHQLLGRALRPAGAGGRRISGPQLRRRFARGQRIGPDPGEKARDPVHQPMPQVPELLRRHLQRGDALRAHEVVRLQGSPRGQSAARRRGSVAGTSAAPPRNSK